MIRRPPRSPRTDTLFPFTTLFRSTSSRAPAPRASCRARKKRCLWRRRARVHPKGAPRRTIELLAGEMVRLTDHDDLSRETVLRRLAENELKPWRQKMWCVPAVHGAGRSEERREGKRGVSPGRERWSPAH